MSIVTCIANNSNGFLLEQNNFSNSRLGGNAQGDRAI
jgi:hypothetical protein